MFFTKPPVVHDVVVKGKEGQVLKHSQRYLVAKMERERLREERKRARQMEVGGKLEGAKRVRV